MNWNEWVQHLDNRLLCYVGFVVLICLGFLAAEPVGLLIGHTLLLFPAFRQYLARKKNEEFLQWWDQNYPIGITARIYCRVGDGEERFVSTLHLGGVVPESKVNPPDESMMDKVSELEKLKTDAQSGVSPESETSQ